MVHRKVKFVSSSGSVWPWQRQIPSEDRVWGETKYAIDSEPDFVPDWLVVYEGWTHTEFSTRTPLERRIFVCGEPESLNRYDPRFLEQFGHVITTQRGIRHQGAIYSQAAINWFVGVEFNGPSGPYVPKLSFADFEAGNPPKTKLCSIVCSTKAVTPGHRQRLDFVELLKEVFGDQIDIYGRGFREIKDKDEALAGYRFHIALENSSLPDYWTEKLADSFLRGCLPIYAGCPNLSEYFPTGSYVPIDLNKPSQAVETIKGVLRSRLDVYHSVDLAEAKRRVLWEHNIFALLERVYMRLERQVPSCVPQAMATVLLRDHVMKSMRFRRRVKSFLRRMLP